MLSAFEQQFETRAQEKLIAIQQLGFYKTSVINANIEPLDTLVNSTVANDQLRQTQPEEFSQVCVVGRIMANRRAGKSGFVDLVQNGQRFQIYMRQDKMGEANYSAYKLFDRGDIVQVEGKIFRTTQGELTVEASAAWLLTKNYRPLPDKFNGLTDHEQCYRQRYVDLFTNKSSRQVFSVRSGIIARLRSYLTERDFMEVETPMLQNHAGGAAARPFNTHHNALDQSMSLRIAPELYLKRLVVGGFDRVFELNRNFRNEGLSTKHNPEFTMLEFYQAYANYQDAMNFVERLILQVACDVCGSSVLEYLGVQLDFGAWKRVDMRDAILQTLNLIHFSHADFESVSFVNQLLPKDAPYSSDIGTNILTIFEHLVEPNLIQPTMIYNFPKSVSPLSKTCEDNANWVERFELYAAGMELGNAFSELTDAADQLGRFQQQALEDSEATVDLDYVEALKYGMPPTVGVGIGVDRLVMLFTNSANIRDVILFPTMRKV